MVVTGRVKLKPLLEKDERYLLILYNLFYMYLIKNELLKLSHFFALFNDLHLYCIHLNNINS